MMQTAANRNGNKFILITVVVFSQMLIRRGGKPRGSFPVQTLMRSGDVVIIVDVFFQEVAQMLFVAYNDVIKQISA